MMIEELLGLIFNFWTGLAVLSVIVIKTSVRFVPQNMAFVVERFGKFNKTMEAGLNILLPFIDRIAYRRSLKEQAFDVPSQSAITQDNISLVVDGVLYIKVVDPYKASYGVDNYVYAVTQLAQTTMRSEIGKISLDKTFEERESLNINIVAAINEAAVPWGVQVLRYKYRKYKPPFHWKTTLTTPKQPGHFAARRRQSHLMRWLNWLTRPDFGPVTLSNQTVSRAPPLPGVAGNVLVIHERIFLTQISSFVAGRDSRAAETHPDIHLFPSGDPGSS